MKTTYKVVVAGQARSTVYRSLIQAHKVARNQVAKTYGGHAYIVKRENGLIVWQVPS